MKTFNVFAVISLILAVAGIMFTHGETSVISVVSCIPLLGFTVTLIVAGIRNWLNDK